MYFILDRFGALHPCRWVEDWPYIEGINWEIGQKFETPIPVPLEFELEEIDEDASDQGPEMPEYLKGTIPLFRDDLLKCMFDSGVDNLDTYEVVIRDLDSGKEYTNYKAVNIVGSVAVADLDKSVATIHPGGPVIDVDFDSLALDEDKAMGRLIFRLAESTNAIMVHEKLKSQLIKAGFTNLEFMDPKEVAL